MCVLHRLRLGDEVVVALQEDPLLVGVVLRGDGLDLALCGDSLPVGHAVELVEDQVEQFALLNLVAECEVAHGGSHGGTHDLHGETMFFKVCELSSSPEDEEPRDDAVHLVVGMPSSRILLDEDQGVQTKLPSTVDEVLAVARFSRQLVEDLVVGGVAILGDHVEVLPVSMIMVIIIMIVMITTIIIIMI